MIREVFHSAIMLGLFILAARTTEIRSKCGFFLMTAALLALPREMFRQIYPWAAGFFNYVPPVMLFFAAERLMWTAMADTPPQHMRTRLTVLFFIGFISQLFIEHCTIWNLWAGIVILVFAVRNRKKTAAPAVYLAGAALGAALLFASPVYRQLDGAYASGLSAGIAAALAMAREHFQMVLDYLIVRCPVLFVPITVFGTAAALYRKPRSILDTALSAGFVGLALVLLAGCFLPVEERLLRTAGVLWLAVLFAACLRWIDDPVIRGRALFFSTGAVIVSLPLLFVNPIGPRCLFAGYVFLLIVSGCFLKSLNPAWLHSKTACWAGVLIAALTFGFYMQIYWSNHAARTRQMSCIRQAMAREDACVVLERLPYEAWVWDETPQKMMAVFYYEIPGDLEITWKD